MKRFRILNKFICSECGKILTRKTVFIPSEAGKFPVCANCSGLKNAKSAIRMDENGFVIPQRGNKKNKVLDL